MSSFCHWEENILVLNILGRPRAKRNAIGKVIGKRLEIHVAENPARGKATAHLVQFLAEEFQVPKSAITVVYGVYNVNKQVASLHLNNSLPLSPRHLIRFSISLGCSFRK